MSNRISNFSPNRFIFALRLLFVIIFEHFVFGVCKLIDFGVPDIPESLDIKVMILSKCLPFHPKQIKREKFLAKRALQDMVEARPAKEKEASKSMELCVVVKTKANVDTCLFNL